MEKSRGATIEPIVKKNITIAALCNRMGVSRGSIYNYFTYHNLDWEIIDKIGRIIGHDFHLEFPDMPIFLTENNNEIVNTVEEPAEPYTGYTHQKCIEELNIWKNKYINLLEEHNQILRNSRK